MKFSELNSAALANAYMAEKKKYDGYIKDKQALDISRGKPCSEQLDVVMPMLDAVNSTTKLPKGLDYRNYGMLEGIPELREIFAQLFDVPAANIILGGNSSLNLMYDMVTRSILFGVLGAPPWCKLPNVKFICPVPGYDRHFTICEKLGIEMISVPMNEEGPDMDVVEDLVANDSAIKGIWCVPRFSNPSGIVYSDRVVKRLASMKTAAADFRIYWDNAYFIHAFNDTAPQLANIFTFAKESGTEDRIYMFSSTSKMTFPGSGVSLICASQKNIAAIKEMMGWQIISYNKMEQYTHAMYLKSVENVKSLMAAQANIIRPKFNLILDALENNFGSDNEYVCWNKPKGGYFICLTTMPGTAKKVVELCKKAGLILTPAGATHPLHNDDKDSTLRIVPTYPSVEELKQALEVLVTCIKIAIFEKIKND